MEDGRNNTAVERRLKDAMKNDRARLQLGRISPFGLMELSRQRLRPSLLEINFEKCPHCAGIGLVRSADSAALSILRAIEEEGIRQRSAELVLHVHTRIALYILNQKRDVLTSIEQRYNLHVLLHSDDTLVPPDYRLERSRQRKDMGRKDGPAVNSDQILAETGRDLPPEPMSRDEGVEPYEGGDLSPSVKAADEAPASDGRRRFREGSGTSRRGRGRGRQGQAVVAGQGAQPVVSVEQPRQSEFVPDGTSIVRVPVDNNGETEAIPAPEGGAALDADGQQRRRRRGRRGGRRRGGEGVGEGGVRSPRDPNAPDSSRWRQNTTDEVQQQAYAPDDMPPVIIPKSIHEIDTTPKEIDTRPSSPSPHETVNPESDSPKGGWWRRLTGQ